MLKRIATVLGWMVLGTLLVPTGARAEGDGIQIGAGRLHPFFDIDSYFDTAGQLTTSSTGQIQDDPDLIFHFRPGLKLDIPSDVFAVSLSAALEYLYYVPLSGAAIQPGLDRFQGGGDLDIGIFRGAVVGVNLDDHLTRSSQTQNPSLPYGLLSLYNDASISVPIIPGGGSLTITPGYHFILEDYSNLLDADEPLNAPSLDYTTQRITLENRWRFLPKTAFLLDGEYDIRSYEDTSVGNADLSFFMVTAGVAGLITPHIATILRVGYGMTTSDSAVSGVTGIVGQAEVSYLPNESTTLRLGFSRTFQPISFPYDAYVDNRPYVGAKTQLFGRLALRATLSLDYLQYVGGTGPARDDLAFVADVGADFEATRWLLLSLGDTFTNRGSDLANTPENPGLNYTDEQIYLRVSFHY
jgi:hypothetical protein